MELMVSCNRAALKHVLCDYEGGRTEAELEPEIEEIKLALVANARAIYSLFDFAIAGSSGNFTVIGFNAYKQFVTDNALAIDRSKHCDDSMLDRLFVQVNSAELLLLPPPLVPAAKSSRFARICKVGNAPYASVSPSLATFSMAGDGRLAGGVSLCEHLQTHLFRKRSRAPMTSVARTAT